MLSKSPFAHERLLITGVASGIGKALAIRMSAEGAAIAGIDRNLEAMSALSTELGGRPFASAAADVTDRARLIATVRKLEAELGPIDRLIACAGIGRGTPADPFSSADFEEVIRVNLIGVANAVEAVLPGMIARKKGHLVALSSLASFRGVPKMAAYCASKAGLNAMFDSLAIELKPHNVRVTTVCPGFIRTPMTVPFQDGIPEMMDLNYAVARILDAIRRRKRFAAFPARPAWILRLMRSLPVAWSDRLMQWQAERAMGAADLARPSGAEPN